MLKSPLALGITYTLLSGCAAPLSAPDGAALARSRLTQLQSNNNLANLAPIEIQAAEEAVSAAEIPRRDTVLEQHLVIMADFKVNVATAWAQSRLYENQRDGLEKETERVRLEARTREATLARRDANSARESAADSRTQTQTAENAAEEAQLNAENSRRETVLANTASDIARNETAIAREQTETLRQEAEDTRQSNEDLRRQIRELNAVNTDRGLVVVLGDVLFETGKAELRASTTDDLNKLAQFLTNYSDRTVLIEGHTDDVGSEQSNFLLSRNRADAVNDFLVSKGIQSSRLTAMGKGESTPVADNLTAGGRQQNRRVEVIISPLAESPR
jgi:outer membrane protein OmpA-like peptidoglycan-associated protein